ncbi:copper-fist-domain-containing protein [Rhizopus microsporus var. microsporus]|uniref:Copper-fist-domain-containing protein n=1 Tax=Rhizopus microsporus var. microsporus TaxID=86635 RepID=A0A1X0R0H1_RHIZD|nr:copper-fist-domain-containing protein [Rhizopus microsporus var. microsporus]
MIINGQKWSCETCIKGHRASSCEHTDRQLILIKKKGRPATQCLKCRELRIVRQLHRRCECLSEKTCCTPVKQSNDDDQEPLKKCCSTQTAFTSKCCTSDNTSNNTSDNNNNNKARISSCCNSNSGGCCSPSLLPNNGARPAMSCLGPAAKNQQGEIIRLVTCRCGDNCACIGCDAHPSRAMKEGRNDVYIGFNESHTRKLSISAITWPSSSNPDPSSPKPDFPETILAEDGTMLCGCGCAKKFEDCSSCILRLCHSEYS